MFYGNHTLTADTERMIETFLSFCFLFQEATGRFVFKEHNTNSYNDVHLCRKAQTTASNRQSPKAEWFLDAGPILKQDILQGYMKTQ